MEIDILDETKQNKTKEKQIYVNICVKLNVLTSCVSLKLNYKKSTKKIK